MAKKAKTNKAAKKRFRITASGKVLHRAQSDNTHLKTNKNRAQKARKRRLRALASHAQIKKIKSLIN
jgi:ribosomal protein L35